VLILFSIVPSVPVPLPVPVPVRDLVIETKPDVLFDVDITLCPE
jgi:hypothetical protein